MSATMAWSARGVISSLQTASSFVSAMKRLGPSIRKKVLRSKAWTPRPPELSYRTAATSEDDVFKGAEVMAAKEVELPDKSRGGLFRFHVENLPSSEGMIAQVEGDEFSHMVKVLRLKLQDRVEIFDGRGGIANGRLVAVRRHAAEVLCLETPRVISPVAPHWHVAAAFGSLKGGRGDWLVEKCTELGARSLTPLLTQRSQLQPGGRSERWQRIAMAATKQCQRLHCLDVREATPLHDYLPQVAQVNVAFVASAGADPLVQILEMISGTPTSGILFIGPEGDFAEDEINSLTKAGATAVGLGPRRLRVETAAVAMLATVMLLGDKRVFESQDGKNL